MKDIKADKSFIKLNDVEIPIEHVEVIFPTVDSSCKLICVYIDLTIGQEEYATKYDKTIINWIKDSKLFSSVKYYYKNSDSGEEMEIIFNKTVLISWMQTDTIGSNIQIHFGAHSLVTSDLTKSLDLVD